MPSVKSALGLQLSHGRTQSLRHAQTETHHPPLPWSEYLPCRISVIVGIHLLSHVQLFATPWAAARQTSLSFTISWNLLKLMSLELVIPSNHLILWHPLFLLASIFPSIRIFSSESALHIKWPKYWSFSFNISPSNEYLS